MQTKQLIFCYGADVQNCVLCSTTKLEAFAAVLIIRWNTDAAGTDEVFKKIGVNCGINTYIGSRKQNDLRISATAQKCSSVIKTAVDNCNKSVKGKALILYLTHLEHLVLRSSLELLMKLMLRKKPQELKVYIRQTSISVYYCGCVMFVWNAKIDV